jgi:phenylacetate-CoA oxygenase PaaI subunit
VGPLASDLRPAMASLLSTLADNKYVLGRRYAEWCTGAPMLESAVAAAAMAQDELGHARSFYPLLRGFRSSDLNMEDKGWQNRPASAMRCLDERFGGWIDFVAANVVVDTAMTTLLASAVDSPYEPLRQRARKIVQEEATHWVHGAGWLRRLADRMDAPLAAVWDDAFTWFGQPDDPALGPLVAGGLLAEGPDALRARLKTRLAPLLEAASLTSLLERPLLGGCAPPCLGRVGGGATGFQARTASSYLAWVGSGEKRSQVCIQPWVFSNISRVYGSKTIRSPGPKRRTSAIFWKSCGISRSQ